MKIEVVNTDYPIEVPNGSIVTIVEYLEGGCVCATKDGGDDFEWFMTSGTYRTITTITIEAGKYYRTRDGRKVGPMEENQMPNDPWPWKSTDDGQFVAFDKDGKAVGEYLVDGMKPNLDLIAEWTEDDDMNSICDERKDGPFVKIDLVEIGTLAELNVKPGDVVECVDAGSAGLSYVPGKVYTVGGNDEGGREIRADEKYSTFRIISRAYDTSKTWGEMTDAEKGELLLAWQQGKDIEFFGPGGWEITYCDPTEWDVDAYRIKPEPKRETVGLDVFYNSGFGVEAVAGSSWEPTHRITFDTIDGTPDLTSIKMERV